MKNGLNRFDFFFLLLLAKYHHQCCGVIFQRKYDARCQGRERQTRRHLQKDEDILSFGDLVMVIMMYYGHHDLERDGWTSDVWHK